MRARGFSLVEVMISLVCFSIIGLGVAGVGTASSTSMKINAARLECQRRADRCLERLVRTVRTASLGEMLTMPEGFQSPQPIVDGVDMDDLTFRTFAVQGPDNGALPALTEPYVVTTQASEIDPTNGVDDDGDGIIDGRDLVVQRPGQAPEVLARNVSPLTFVCDGRTLSIRLGVQMRSPDGSILQAIVSRIVEIRND